MTQPTFGRPPSLEDFLGLQTGQRAAFGGFVNQNMPGLAGRFRQFVDRRQGPTSQNFLLDALTNGQSPLNMQDYLGQRSQQSSPIQSVVGGIGGPSTGSGATAKLNAGADLLRGGPFAPNITDAQRAIIQGLSGDPVAQFEMALPSQILPLGGPARNGFQAMARRMLDSVLANNGLNPNFQYLPHVQENNFQLW